MAEGSLPEVWLTTLTGRRGWTKPCSRCSDQPVNGTPKPLRWGVDSAKPLPDYSIQGEPLPQPPWAWIPQGSCGSKEPTLAFKGSSPLLPATSQLFLTEFGPSDLIPKTVSPPEMTRMAIAPRRATQKSWGSERPVPHIPTHDGEGPWTVLF